MFYLRGKEDDLSSLKNLTGRFHLCPQLSGGALGAATLPSEDPRQTYLEGQHGGKKRNSVQTSGWSKFRIPADTQKSPTVETNAKDVSNLVIATPVLLMQTAFFDDDFDEGRTQSRSLPLAKQLHPRPCSCLVDFSH